jgi:hypothetical protein
MLDQEHMPGGPGVGSSNLPAPTISPIRFQRLAREVEPPPISCVSMTRRRPKLSPQNSVMNRYNS